MKSIRFCHLRGELWQSTAALILLTICLCQPSFSQGATLFVNSIAGSGPANSVLKLNEVNSRAARHFYKYFPGSQNEKWTLVDHYYVASFSNGDRLTRAYYNSKGEFAESVNYYPAGGLNETTRALIMKKFPGHTIDVVTEISNGEDRFYIIKIRAADNFKTLKIVAGNIEVTEDLQIAGA